MKPCIKKITAGMLAAGMLFSSAGAINQNGEDETWFDGVWTLIDGFGLEAENNPYVLQNYINKYLERHPDELYEVINDILAILDTHSMYLSAEEYSNGYGSLEGYVGIGVVIEYTTKGAQISSVLPYSAAEEAGIMAGDIIIKIDNIDMTGAGASKAAEYLRGEEGTNVSITLLRGGKTISVSVTRRVVNQIFVTNQTVSEGVEYIRIGAMGSENDWTEFEKIWNGLDEKDTKSVILDLRGNGGGLIDVSQRILNLITEKKDAYLFGIRWREDMGGIDKKYAKGDALPLNKVIVLVDGGTASAAELLAGSLQDTGTATLVGTQTYGKGQGQFHIPLINGDKLVITTLELELPKTGAYEGIGLTPNIIKENRIILVDKNNLSELEKTRPIYFGEQSANVYAMTERLAMLGLLSSARETFDYETIDAIQKFYKVYEMKPVYFASEEMLKQLDDAVILLHGEQIAEDTQFETALEMAKLAAAKPKRYESMADGSFKPIQ